MKVEVRKNLKEKFRENFNTIKRLRGPQKTSLGFIVLLVLLLPVWVTLSLNRISSQSSRADNPATPVTPPNPAPTGFDRALYLQNTDVRNENPTNGQYFIVTPPSMISNNPFTIEVWVKHSTPPSGTYVRVYNLLSYIKPQSPYDYGYIYNLSLEVQESNGQARPMFSALIANSFSTLNSNYISVGGTNQINLQPDVWNHVAISSYSAGSICHLELFINGVLSDSSEKYGGTSTCNISSQQPQELRVGRPEASSGGISGYYYDGKLDEFRISNNTRYAANFSPLLSPFNVDQNTILLYHLNGDLNEVSNPSYNGRGYGNFSFVPSDIVVPTTIPTSVPTPTPTPKVYLNSVSGTNCNTVCNSNNFSCVSVGTDRYGTNNKYWQVSKNTCVETNASCATVMKKTANKTCSGNKSSWTNCQCD